MLSNVEIKDRFLNSGKLVDRHGQFVDGHLSDGRWNPSLSRLAHYRLLDGMKDDELGAQLKEQGLSPLEIKFTLKAAHTFIKDVLEIDLATRQAERISTSGKCYAMLHDMIAWVNQAYEEAVVQPVEFDGFVFQADAKAQQAIALYLRTGQAPDYWVDANNEKHDFNLEKLEQLNEVIVTRISKIHEKVTDFKRDARMLAEKSEYAKLKALRDKFVVAA